MKTERAYRNIRLILFGPMPPAFEVIGRSPIREALIAVAKGQYPNVVPREAIELGLLVHKGSGWVPGPRLVCLPCLHASQAAAIREGGRECAAIILAALPSLREALSLAIGGEPVSLWHQYAFLTVAALLLDLQIGESLRHSRQVEKVTPGWRVWAVPHDPLVPAFGVRCVQDPVSGLGAGVCWHEKLSSPPLLPEPLDLCALSVALAGGQAAPEALVRLRFGGWLEGLRPTVPLFPSDASLWSTLQEVADRAVEDAYVPVLKCVRQDQSARSEQPLLIARMIMEQALKRLIASAAVPAPGPSTVYRWLWNGRSWCLAAETVGC